MNRSLMKLFPVIMVLAAVASPAVARRSGSLVASIQQGVATPVETPWEKFSPAGSGFAVLFPGKPKDNDGTLDTKIGDLIQHQYGLEQGSSFFMVSTVEYPETVTDSARIKTMLDAGREGGLKATNGVLKSEKEITLGQYLGREWVVIIASGIARARAYWVRDRLYQVIVMMENKPGDDAEKAREATMTKFLDSFELTGDAPK